MISANDNRQLKNITLLMKNRQARSEQRAFVIEGPKMFLEAPKEKIKSIFVSETFERENCRMLEEYGEYEVVTDKRFSALCDTKTPQGIIAISEMPKWDREAILSGENPLILILENIQDPGNIGTMIRTSLAACADAVFVSKGSVDIFNPKVVRSTMGAVYRIPVFTDENIQKLLAELSDRGITSYAAHLEATESCFDKDFKKGTAFIIGNESNGITDETAESAGEKIIIPMSGEANSLNAAISAGVLLYEAVRQRR
ncbi:MAG: TrmH family RNA methyltransferase [Lachnospiraceae bacterium]|jgi:TrmH family RNA methyltransferase